jgi:2-polyprenyl-3-methyl-5-hydroxy-6-metoxy-1,4-benzoquinol methylase
MSMSEQNGIVVLLAAPADSQRLLFGPANALLDWLRAGADAPLPDAITEKHMPSTSGAGLAQKLAFRYALDHGADAALVSHGRTSDSLTALLDAFIAQPAELLLLAPRQHPSRSARLQDRWTDTNWGDYPVHCRAFSRSLLERVPFDLNSDGPLFDVELLLQASYAGAEIRRTAIAAGESQAAQPPLWPLARTIWRFRAHQAGMLCSLRYRDLAPIRYRDKTQPLYTSHRMALAQVAELAPKRVLDLGCGPGFVARGCRELGCEVAGVDCLQPLPDTVSTFVAADLDRDQLPLDISDFDLVLLLDVIEHLQNPEQFLLRLRHHASSTGRLPALVISTPNVAFLSVRLNLLLGRFPYAERGILDITHCRLFTRASLLEMLHDCGYEVEQVLPVPVPFTAVWPGRWGRIFGFIAQGLARLWPGGFAFQLFVRCRPKPGLQQLLNEK